ncbi:hypothetical protein LIER_36889 [Lithospermum erythrorhizon]|uniref:Uncharacterized protein n=1 Tax=Lithospermum erythrorhizon TaxID=34254 RepID=A0AAV3PE09_LITER
MRKVVITLPKRFSHKVTAIEEAQDLTTMRFDELIGNLTTFEMMFESTKSNNEKGIALQANYKDKEEEDLTKTMSLLAKKFKKNLKCFNKKTYSGGNNPAVNDKWIDKGWKNSKFGGSNSGSNQQNKRKGIHCRKCEGFRHIQVECPNYVKNQSTSYYTTLFNDESNKEEESDNKFSNFVAFTARDSKEDMVSPIVIDHSIDNISDDEGDLTEEELMTNYQILFMKLSKLTQAYTTGEIEWSTPMQKNQELIKGVEEQRVEIYILEKKVQGMIKGIKMMNSSTTVLYQILLQGKRS